MSNFVVYEARDNNQPNSNSTEETYQSTTAGLLSRSTRDDGAFSNVEKSRDAIGRTTSDSGEYTEYITQGTVCLQFLYFYGSLFLWL